jgi:hypothetical protein
MYKCFKADRARGEGDAQVRSDERAHATLIVNDIAKNDTHKSVSNSKEYVYSI